MNNQEVYIVFGFDEIYLGTVGELTGVTGASSSKIGQGISPTAMISDIVSEMISGDERRKILSLHIREPYCPGVE